MTSTGLDFQRPEGQIADPIDAHGAEAAARHQCMVDLEQAVRDLDAFSHSVAHELRGPLRLIDGFSLMLLQDNAQQLNEEGRTRLDMVRTSAQRMSQLIDDLLHLARMNRSEFRRIPFELSALVRTVADQIRDGQRDRSVTLVIADGLEVDADPQLLRIVLANLLGNAWKFSANRADARIEFGAQEIDGERCYYIRDNGVGFDMRYAAKLFVVFQRLHSASEFQGAGIGLATVKRIVTRHGGRIWATGEVGAGATFFFTLGVAARVPSSAHSAAVA
jgi:light-regulated signal transduction histidine kinase (bacteriophytochrome)